MKDSMVRSRIGHSVVRERMRGYETFLGPLNFLKKILLVNLQSLIGVANTKAMCGHVYKIYTDVGTAIL